MLTISSHQTEVSIPPLSLLVIISNNSLNSIRNTIGGSSIDNMSQGSKSSSSSLLLRSVQTSGGASLICDEVEQQQQQQRNNNKNNDDDDMTHDFSFQAKSLDSMLQNAEDM